MVAAAVWGLLRPFQRIGLTSGTQCVRIPFLAERWRARRGPPSSPSTPRSLWRCSWAWARPASATSLHRCGKLNSTRHLIERTELCVAGWRSATAVAGSHRNNTTLVNCCCVTPFAAYRRAPQHPPSSSSMRSTLWAASGEQAKYWLCGFSLLIRPANRGS